MPDYCSLNDVRVELKLETTDTADDALISGLIADSTKEIETFTARRFYGTVETRYFDAVKDVMDRTLFLDEDLTGVVSITNGDSETITTSQYVLEPANLSPKYGITLKASSSKSWTYTTDPEQAIAVNGTWGFMNGTVPPSDIKRACIRLTAWRYKQPHAPFQTVGLPEVGQVVVPTAMPIDVQRMLQPYVRRTPAGI